MKKEERERRRERRELQKKCKAGRTTGTHYGARPKTPKRSNGIPEERRVGQAHCHLGVIRGRRKGKAEYRKRGGGTTGTAFRGSSEVDGNIYFRITFSHSVSLVGINEQCTEENETGAQSVVKKYRNLSKRVPTRSSTKMPKSSL